MGQQADVCGELVGRYAHLGQEGENPAVPFAAVSLAGYRLGGRKAHLPDDQVVQLPNQRIVPLKQLQEAGLGAGGALAAKGQVGSHQLLALPDVADQVVHPQAGALAQGGGLGGLKVGVGEDRQGLVLFRKGTKGAQDGDQPGVDQGQGVPDDQAVGIVPDIAAGGAQVDDGRGLRALVREGVDVGHHVVAEGLFIGRHLVKVDIGEVFLHFGDLPVGDGQAELLLGLRQDDPEPAPQLRPVAGGKEKLHLVAGVPGGKGGNITVQLLHRKAPP